MKKLPTIIFSLFATLSLSAAISTPIKSNETISGSESFGQQLSIDGAKVEITGSLTLTAGQAPNWGANTLTLTNGASLDVTTGSLYLSASDGAIRLNSGTSMTVSATAGDVQLNKFNLTDGGTLIVYKENAFSNFDNETATKLMFVGGGTFNAQASQTFLEWDVRANGTLQFGSNVILTYQGISIGNITDGKTLNVTLKDFSDTNSLIFQNTNALSLTDNILTITISNKTVKYAFINEDSSAVEGLTLSDVGGNKVLAFATANVPEPAEWAVILGALALGLAIYRRRN